MASAWEAGRPEPCAFVILGASGHLARRKLLPALYNLALDDALPERIAIVGYGRSKLSRDQFIASMRESASQHSRRPVTEAHWQRLAAVLEYIPGEYGGPQALAGLREALKDIDRRYGTEGNRLLYFGTPPSVFEPIALSLRDAGLVCAPRSRRWCRVIVEKPFGRDLESALRLDETLAQTFDESQIYRIDHYLGKETVQNLLVFRFANMIFEPIWNRNYVDEVQITVAEDVGIEGRGQFYEETGVLRDMIQSHVLQLLALVGLEAPVDWQPESLRDQRVQVLRSIRPVVPGDISDSVVVGQYRGYRREPNVAPNSVTPTYAALRLFIDNWRWQGVPFYLRAGKRLAKRVTEVTVVFRCIPVCLFRERDVCQMIDPNVLALRIQPDEGIHLRFGAKLPGRPLRIANVTMDFDYYSAFGAEPPEAYERLLLDCLRGDPSLFTRHDSMQASWRVITPILGALEQHPPADFPNYEPGSWGPAAAGELLRRDHHSWRAL
ncbi:glucose-6-phosphate dehydrogenase [candidate division KD3-62 bacterium DG_56]|uniref:Glucose-6-phosphate 1-dehydrogenase n=1 Tax=candidate division KD3-62 bacterium DG_56 TaxID=1704032 RepID=A0A0S7XR79_9BACT|nr:MAG: glucose-6-phosphate dehydrogenase [candidate division KD3-62 bacterium DG_56]